MSKLSPKKIVGAVWRRVNQKARDMVFPDYARIRHIPQHLDMINLGSTPARFALDYAAAGVNGFNLAVCPQTVTYDWRMLQNYHSFLGQHGARVAAVVLCPFSLLKDRYTEADGDLWRDLRYYPVLHHAMIDNYDEATYQRISRRAPMLLASRANLRTALRRPVDKRLALASNPLDADGMRASAEHYLAGWRREFGIDDLRSSTMADRAESALRDNVALLGRMAAFCDERAIRMAVVLPPLSQTLRAMIPDAFIERNLLAPLREAGLTVYDFMADSDLAADSNFVDALCLNADARRRFTRKLAEKLEIPLK